jgi:hypothetical protein
MPEVSKYLSNIADETSGQGDRRTDMLSQLLNPVLIRPQRIVSKLIENGGSYCRKERKVLDPLKGFVTYECGPAETRGKLILRTLGLKW